MTSLLLALLVGCAPTPPSGSCPDGCDRDGDGWISAADGGWDCDDTDPLRHPGRDEICNFVDDDCDGAIDDADPDLDRTTATVYFPDADRDGYGAEGGGRLFCSRPPGVVPQRGDCDDADPDRHPGQVEVCNVVDDDCDGLTDDDDPDRVSTTTWFADADADGLGDPTNTVGACDTPPGHVANAEDCDDLDASVGGPIPWRPDRDGDGYGQGPATDATCEPPDAHTEADAPLDCHDGDPLRHPDAPEVCGDDVDQDCDARDCRPLDGDGTVDQGIALTGSTILDWFGSGIAAGDADGDGHDDLWVGGAFHGTGRGAVWLFYGPIDAPRDRDAADAVFDGTRDVGLFGEHVVGVGDMDGDGRDELLTAEGGDVVLLHAAQGPIARWPGFGDVAAIAGGLDVNDDGVPDVIATTQHGDGSRCVWIEDLDEAGGVLEGDLDHRTLGVSGDPDFGGALLVHDVTGDGLGDVVVGMPGDGGGGPDAGAVELLLGPTDHEPPRVLRGSTYSRTGESAAAGDVDGDGHPDLVVGAPGVVGTDAARGGAWWQPGPVASVRELPDTAIWLAGTEDQADAGRTVALMDLDGDGFDDVVVGAPLASRGGVERGSLHVLYGPTPGPRALDDADAVIAGVVDHDRIGGSLTGADVSTDGLDDLLVGARWADPAGDASGSVWVLFGSPR